jgi:hypothetical protein
MPAIRVGVRAALAAVTVIVAAGAGPIAAQADPGPGLVKQPKGMS